MVDNLMNNDLETQEAKQPFKERHPKPRNFQPEPMFPEGHRWYGSKRCHAWNFNEGRQCMSLPVRGRDACRVHGGRVPRGEDSPNWRHGRYSKELPKHLIPQYEQALGDPKLLELRDEIALTDARMGELLQRANTGESGVLWASVKRELKAYATARGTGNVPLMTAALANLEDLINQGMDDYIAWREIASLIEQRRKLAESERKAYLEADLVLTVVQAMTLVAGISAVIKEHIHDTPTLGAISEGIRALLPERAG